MVPPSAGFRRSAVSSDYEIMKQRCATAAILQLGKNGEVLLWELHPGQAVHILPY